MSQKPTAEPSEAVRAFLSPAPSEVFSFPRWEARPGQKPVRVERDVRVKLLRLTETHEALRDAQAYAKKLGEIPGEHRDIYNEAKAVELAWRCLCQPKERERQDGTVVYDKIFASAEHLRSSMSEPEIAQVLNLYEVVKAKYGEIEALDQTELDTWADKLSDPLAGEYFLSVLDSNAWPQLLLLWAQEVRSLREEVGRPLASWRDSVESDPTNSEPGTGSFSELPEAQASDGEELPTDHMLTRDEALERGRRMRRKDKKAH